MNEKNSAKAGGLSGTEGGSGNEAEAVNAASADATAAGKPSTDEAATGKSSAETAGDETRADGPRGEKAERVTKAEQADTPAAATTADTAAPPSPADRVQKADEAGKPATATGTDKAGAGPGTGAGDKAGAGESVAEPRPAPDPREPHKAREPHRGSAKPAEDAAADARDDGDHAASGDSQSNTPPHDEPSKEGESKDGKRKEGAQDASAVRAQVPPSEPESASESAPARTPARRGWKESASERTSEFVALKPDLPPSAPSRPASPRPTTPAPASPSPAAGPGESSAEPERTREFAAPRRLDNDRTMALTRPPAPDAAGPAATSGSGGTAEAPPALDLLAQLTNTPPKPETLARTVTRRIKIWGTLIVLLAIVLVTVQALRPLPAPTLKLTGKSNHTADGGALSLPWPSEGQAVVDIDGLGHMGSFGEMNPLPIGSVAKVMTTYLILRDHPLKAGDKGPSIPVDQKAQDDYTNGVQEKESVVEVKAGQQISELEALQAVMLPSANNVARLLARWDASTEEAFIKKMNDTAKELGMTNTTYTDASGLMESTVSTAEDQVKLAKRAMADPVFRQIAKLPSYTSTTTSGGTTVETAKTQRNFNKLVPLYGVVGIKTGSTTKAGGNLLFAAETMVGDSKQLIVGAVFGQHKPSIIETATAASKSLILAAGKELRSETVVKKGEVVGEVEDGLGGSVPVVAAKDLTVPVWSGATVDIKLTDGGKELPHTAKAGTEVGTLTVGSGTGEAKVPVTLRDDLAEPSFGAKLTRLG
ncbi:D-alanyl-D-alanine carboxypeptidase [Streptomyces sp. NPDC050485]|uniref:D-alanyl-D-alanine carboxypeptidase n=1 Tax=Streptomyces sp. NPDC050485 TaxID=3365617 RepID=UPI0037BC58BE